MTSAFQNIPTLFAQFPFPLVTVQTMRLFGAYHFKMFTPSLAFLLFHVQFLLILSNLQGVQLSLNLHYQSTFVKLVQD